MSEAALKDGPICKTHKSRKVHVDCTRCGGEGEIEDYDSFCTGAMETCYQCNGTGIAPWLECEDCIMESIENANDEFETGSQPGKEK